MTSAPMVLKNVSNSGVQFYNVAVKPKDCCRLLRMRSHFSDKHIVTMQGF